MKKEPTKEHPEPSNPKKIRPFLFGWVYVIGMGTWIVISLVFDIHPSSKASEKLDSINTLIVKRSKFLKDIEYGIKYQDSTAAKEKFKQYLKR